MLLWPAITVRVTNEVLDRDVLYLFWSRAASASPWVDKEWRTAYLAKGLDGVEPVPLKPPAMSPPPELAGLHFSDWTLPVREPGERGRRTPEPAGN